MLPTVYYTSNRRHCYSVLDTCGLLCNHTVSSYCRWNNLQSWVLGGGVFWKRRMFRSHILIRFLLFPGEPSHPCLLVLSPTIAAVQQRHLAGVHILNPVAEQHFFAQSPYRYSLDLPAAVLGSDSFFQSNLSPNLPLVYRWFSSNGGQVSHILIYFLRCSFCTPGSVIDYRVSWNLSA